MLRGADRTPQSRAGPGLPARALVPLIQVEVVRVASAVEGSAGAWRGGLEGCGERLPAVPAAVSGESAGGACQRGRRRRLRRVSFCIKKDRIKEGLHILQRKDCISYKGRIEGFFTPPHGLRPRGHGLRPIGNGHAPDQAGASAPGTPYGRRPSGGLYPSIKSTSQGIPGRHLYPVIKPGAPPDAGCCRGIAGRSARQSGGAGTGVPC